MGINVSLTSRLHGSYTMPVDHPRETVHNQVRSLIAVSLNNVPFKSESLRELYSLRAPYCINFATTNCATVDYFTPVTTLKV